MRQRTNTDLSADGQNQTATTDEVDICSHYSDTFFWLRQYDNVLWYDPPAQPGGELPSLQAARKALATLKTRLIAKGEADEYFANEPANGLAVIFEALQQKVFGEPAYPTVESKAAHLLYFIVKDYPFTDGNKRSAAFLFVYFLKLNQRLLNRQGQPCITDTALAALTLLVAESKACQKHTIIQLIMHMLAVKHTD
jgi:prophage maintenance system killer protein